MKRLTVFLIMLLCTAAAAQDLPRIAVYVTGDVRENETSALGTRILASLVNSGRYAGIERSESFLAKIDEEHIKQRSGAIDDGQISELGKQFGVKYICVAAITPAFGAYQVSARIIDVESAQVVHIGESNSPLDNMDDFTWVSDEVVHVMFGGEPRQRPVKKRSGMSIGAGGLFACDFGGGITQNSAATVTIPQMGGGAYLFFDAVYARAVITFVTAGGRLKNPDVAAGMLPDIQHTSVSAGAYAKYPNLDIGPIRIFPLLGAEYEISISGKMRPVTGSEVEFDGRNGYPQAGDFSALWVKLGAGADIALSERLFISSEVMYGARTVHGVEKWWRDIRQLGDIANGHGLTVRAGAGFKL